MRKDNKIYAGMQLKLYDTSDGGVLNRSTVAPNWSQSVEDAYRATHKELELKREGWRSLYPNAQLVIEAE